MKLFLLALLAPCLTFATHSVNAGAFYTKHKERGYTYNLAGVSFSYEIGNSKGLKARGKLQVSNDSDLFYIPSRSEILWFVPFYQLEVMPFFGVDVTSHNVYQTASVTQTLVKSYVPLGIGIRHKLGKFLYEVRGAHMQPGRETFVHQEHGRDFIGHYYHLSYGYMAEGSLTYSPDAFVDTTIVGRWQSNYHTKLKQISLESYISFKF